MSALCRIGRHKWPAWTWPIWDSGPPRAVYTCERCDTTCTVKVRETQPGLYTYPSPQRARVEDLLP